jgi:hypothetical protein
MNKIFLPHVLLATLTVILLFGASSQAFAGAREDWLAVADAIAATGNTTAAETILEALAVIPEADLEKVSAGADLAGITFKFNENANALNRLVESNPALEATVNRYKAFAYEDSAPVTIKPEYSNADGYDDVKPLTPGFPNAVGYPTTGWCPFSPDRSNADALLIAQDVLAGARVLLEAAEVLWSGLSRACDETIVVLGEGGNTSIACIPADVVLFAAELAVGVGETVVEHIDFCDAAVDAAEIEGSYERLGHLHGDIETHESYERSLGAMKRLHLGVIQVEPVGCSQGYWKNHQNLWNSITAGPADLSPNYDPMTLFEDVFGTDSGLAIGLQVDGTLLDGLELRGGGLKAQARNAVTTLLNNDATLAGIQPNCSSVVPSGNLGPFAEFVGPYTRRFLISSDEAGEPTDVSIDSIHGAQLMFMGMTFYPITPLTTVNITTGVKMVEFNLPYNLRNVDVYQIQASHDHGAQTLDGIDIIHYGQTVFHQSEDKNIVMSQ